MTDDKDDKDDDDTKRGLLGHAMELAKRAIIAAEQMITGGANTRPMGPDEPMRPGPLPPPLLGPNSATVRPATPGSSPQAWPQGREGTWEGAMRGATIPTSPSPALTPHAPREAQKPTPQPQPPVAVEPQEPQFMLDVEEPPETYGIDEVSVLPRDPGTVFVYWEATEDGKGRARAALGGDGALTLRLFVVTTHPDAGVRTSTYDVALGWDHGRMYMPAPAPGALLTAALGLRSPDGRFALIAHAPRVHVPPSEPSWETKVEWMEVSPAGTRGVKIEPPLGTLQGPPREFTGRRAGPGPGNGGRPGEGPMSPTGPISPFGRP